jgi:arsenite oxidase large subunit
MDSPGESKPDWQITAMLAKKMGFDGYDWKDSNDVFEEAARFGRGGVLNYHPLVKVAKKKGMRGHDLLRTYGTTGIQTPIRLEDGKLVGTKRLHDSTLELPETGPESHTVWIKKLKSFNTQSGRANFIKTPWFLFEDFYEEVKPKGDELWVINGRFNELWQSGYDDLRRPYIEQRWPENTIHINPEDAKARGIESGDYVMVSSDRIPVQVGGFVARDTKDALYAGLKRDGHIEYDKAEVKAIAVITKSLKPGVSYMVFLHNKDSANRLVARVPDPISNNYRFKLGFGKIKRVGESPYKKNLGMMSMTDPYIG